MCLYVSSCVLIPMYIFKILNTFEYLCGKKITNEALYTRQMSIIMFLIRSVSFFKIIYYYLLGHRNVYFHFKIQQFYNCQF